MDIYRELTSALNNPLMRDRILVYRDEGEHSFLLEWLEEIQKTNKATGTASLIRDIIAACRKCGDVDSKKIPVGTGGNGVMIILNAPQLLNKAEMNFLRNESDELLKKIVVSMKLDVEECYITNVVKCEIKSSLMRPSQIVSLCEKILIQEIDIIRPAVVIVFGDIIPLQKIIKESKGIEWFNVEHPITLIKNPDLKRPAWNTLKLVMEKIPKR